jgi:hypothetical protein
MNRFSSVLIILIVLLIAATRSNAQRCGPIRLPSSFASEYQIGTNVVIDGDVAVVGSRTAASDAVQIFRWNGNSWIPEAILRASSYGGSSYFGQSLDINGNTIVVGDPGYSGPSGVQQGAVFVFVRSGFTWTRQATILTNDATEFANVGYSVAVSGDTLITGAPGDSFSINVEQGSAYIFKRTGTTWAQQSKLQLSDGLSFDRFGDVVAIDDQTVVVGSPNARVGANSAQGRVVVYTRSGNTWTMQQQLVASDAAAGDAFGGSIDISADTVIISSLVSQQLRPDQSAAYIFTRLSSIWTQQQRIALFPKYGGSIPVAVENDTAVIGTRNTKVGANLNQGSALVYQRSGELWLPQTSLTSPDGASGDFFGSSVAISQGRIIIGAPFDTYNAIARAGSAWIFERDGDVWPELPSILTANDGTPGDKFGLDVAVDGNIMVIGARDEDIGSNTNQGAVYVYERQYPGFPWYQAAKLVAFDGGPNQEFGERVAVSGNTIAVGATIDNSARGKVYLFYRDNGTWFLYQTLTSNAPTPGDRYGNDLDISGNTLVVGAFLDDNQGGSAFVYDQDAFGFWRLNTKIQSPDTAAGDFFGTSVAIDGDTIVVGIPADDFGSTDRGTIAVFTRTNNIWTQRTKFSASDTAGNNYFGEYVDIDNGTILVGAYGQLNNSIRPGAAYIFTGSGSAWVQQARLDGPDSGADDRFGSRVVLRGDVAVIGSTLSDIPGASDSGAAYVFARLNNQWTFRTKITAFDARSGDIFGAGLEIDGNNVLVGAGGRQEGINAQQGAVYSIPLTYQCNSLVYNMSLNTSHASLAAAMLPAQSGHQIIATPGAWNTVSSLDTLGRSIGFTSTGWIYTPISSTITLGGSSYLSAGADSNGYNAGDDEIQVNGQLRTSSGGSAEVLASVFTLKNAGTLTARLNSSLSITAANSELRGTTRLEQGSALSFAGDVTNNGPLNAFFSATLSSTGVFTNQGSLTLTSGSIAAQNYINAAQSDFFGTSAIFGNFVNSVQATTNIRSGTLFVFGDLTNNGTILGTICANCMGAPPNMDIGGSFTIGASSSLIMPFDDSAIRVEGSFNCAINSNTRFHLSLATLQLESSNALQTLEVMSRDIGADVNGLDRSLAGHFPIHTVHIGPSPTVIQLVDFFDNDNESQSFSEAIYVDTLRVDVGSHLINSTSKIYYNTLILDGSVEVLENLISLAPPCPADFNQDGGIDGSDVADFYFAWENAQPQADTNQDGGIDGADVDAFFIAWSNGGC